MPIIRPACAADLADIWALVQRAVRHMNALGNPQWGEDYPTKCHYADDIARGELYLAHAPSGALLGAACINCDESPEYAAVSWCVPGPAVVVHRMAVDPDAQRQGVGKALFSCAVEIARAKGVASLRVDTYGENNKMQALLLGFGFQPVGEINLHGRPLKFPCFEKTLPVPKSR